MSWNEKCVIAWQDFTTFLDAAVKSIAKHCKGFQAKVFSEGTRIYTKAGLFSPAKEAVKFTFACKKHKGGLKSEVDWIDILIDVKDTRFLETIKSRVRITLAPEIAAFLKDKGRFYYMIKIKQDEKFWYGKYVGVPRKEYT